MEKKDGKDKSKIDSKSFVKSLKNKSKKILNSKKERPKKGRPAKQAINNGSSEPILPIVALPEGSDEMDFNNDSPPSLQRQSNENLPQEDIDVQSSSNTEVQSTRNDNEANVTKSSAPLCAKYLKACEELSRKLSKYQLTQDEMIACFKYSMIRDCLGDVDLAAQKIAFGNHTNCYFVLNYHIILRQ